MAKMTDDEKKARKIAYDARRKEYNNALRDMERRQEEIPEAVAFDEADSALCALREAYIEESGKLRGMISELEDKAKKLHVEFTTNPAHGRRIAARGAWDEARHAIGAELEARFPDLQGCYGVGTWKPELIPQEAKE